MNLTGLTDLIKGTIKKIGAERIDRGAGEVVAGMVKTYQGLDQPIPAIENLLSQLSNNSMQNSPLEKVLLKKLNEEATVLNQALIETVVSKINPISQSLISKVKAHPDSLLAAGVGSNPNLDLSKVLETVKANPDSRLAAGVASNPNLDLSEVLDIVKANPDSLLAEGVGENLSAQMKYLLKVNRVDDKQLAAELKNEASIFTQVYNTAMAA